VQEHCTPEEIVELTAIASLAAMADRITNALRIAPEGPIGVTADLGPVDGPTDSWRDAMFDDDVGSTWKETMTP
jgi:hypothetical protein